MAVPVAIFLAVNAGQPSAGGWGTAMSTDTAFALGMLALVGPKNADRLRSYLLTFAVVDDLTAIVVIALVYSHHIDVPALLAGLAALAAVFAGPDGRPAAGRGVRRARPGGVGGVLQVRGGPGGHRPGDRPAHPGIPGRAQRPGAGHRPGPPVP